jgi:hypothetical protein
MTERISCMDNGCPFPSGSEFHCTNCHLTFGTLTLFDAHQDVDYERSPVVICNPPAPDLVQNERGTWQTPEGLERRKRLAGQARSARMARTHE